MNQLQAISRIHQLLGHEENDTVLNLSRTEERANLATCLEIPTKVFWTITGRMGVITVSFDDPLKRETHR